MIIEQAFYNLPEILVGAGYAKQEYEAGIVSAYSLALLQELNGRNVSLPISAIYAEKQFSAKFSGLRSDLHVDLYNRLFVGSTDYAEFGFRLSNWIEAKFFRTNPGGTPPSTQNLGKMIADILRLVALVPSECRKDEQAKEGEKSTTGRYLLHVYRGDPLWHLNPTRKSPKSGQSKTRGWVEPLMNPGFQEIADFELAHEEKDVFKYLGAGMRNCTCSLKITNRTIEPRGASGHEYYKFVLTRIDSAVLQFNNRTLTLNLDRTFSCDPAGEVEKLREEIAAAMKPKKEKKAKGSKAKTQPQTNP